MYSMVLDVNWMLVSPYQWVFGTKYTEACWSALETSSDHNRIPHTEG